MGKGTKHGSKTRGSAKYANAMKRPRDKRRAIEREIIKAEAKIRQIKSRVERGVISTDASKAPIARQEKHLESLRERLEQGFTNRPDYNPGSKSKDKKKGKDK